MMKQEPVGKKKKPYGKYSTFNGVEFVIDGIGKETVTGHFVFRKEDKQIHHLPVVELSCDKSAVLNNIKIKVRQH